MKNMPSHGREKKQLILDTFWPEDAQAILAIPIDMQMEDWPAWHFDPKGLFSVKSAYKRAVQIRDSKLNRDASSFGSNIEKGGSFWWQIKLQNKVKMFAWRMAHNSLPVRRNIARKGVKIDTMCPMCNCLDEDCGHLFSSARELSNVGAK